MAALTVPTIFTAIDKFTAPLRAMTQASQSFATKTQLAVAQADRAFNRLMMPISRVTSALGSMGLVVGGAAIVGGLVSVIGIFKDFEQANANLASVLGKSKAETVALNEDAKRLGATTAFTASQVAGLQTEFAKLGLSQDEILGATEATLALAAATNTELPQAAAQVGSALRAFGLDASEAARVADVFAASTSKSALDMAKLETGMATVAPVAKAFGFSIEDSVALLGKLSDAGFDASSAATATRNIILNMADSGGKLAKALGRPVNSLEDMVSGMEHLRAKGVDLAKMLDLTDQRSVAAFATFVNGADGIRNLAGELVNAGGTAQRMAETQLDTLNGALTILGSSYEGFILSMEDGTGAFSNQLKVIVQVISEMFSLAAGSATATAELSEGAKRIRSFAETGLFLIKAIGTLIGVMIAWKAAILLTKGALVVYNAIANAIFLVDMIKYTASTQGLTVAQAALAIAQGELNTIMAANPMGLMVIGIAALIAVVVVAISYWNQFGAALIAVGSIIATVFSPALALFGLVLSIIMSIYHNWTNIVEAFKGGGIVDGVKMIGKVLLDAVLNPLQQIISLIAKVTGFDWAANAAKSLENFRADMGVNVAQSEPVAAVNPKQAEQDAMVSRMETVSKQNVAIDIKDQTGRAAVSNSGGAVPINLTSTQAWQ
jgi:TP901 family phage tail tape measure protein